MLDQHSDSVLNDPQSIAHPLDGLAAPNLRSSQTRDQGYAGSGNAVIGNYSPANGTYSYITFNGGKVEGTGNNAFDVNQVSSELQVTNGADSVTLGSTLHATDEGVFDPKDGTPYTGRTETIKFDESVASGKHIFEWKNGANFVQLMVMVTGENTAQSCWTYKLPKTQRTYCNNWQVPADFAHGKPLRHLGYSIEDATADGKKNRWASK